MGMMIERKKRLMMAQGNSLLPSAYQRVEWIRSVPGLNSNNPIIETGVNASANIHIIIDFLYPEIPGDSSTSYVTGTTKYDKRMNIYIGSNLSEIRYGYLATYGGTGIQPVKNIRYLAELENGRVIINRVSTTFNAQQYTGASEICLCGRYYAAEKQTSNAQIYSAKIYDDSILVRDYVPCYRKSDGEIGLYDAVNKVFYTKIGSINFEKGNNI